MNFSHPRRHDHEILKCYMRFTAYNLNQCQCSLIGKETYNPSYTAGETSLVAQW